jgi:surface protein
MAVYLGNNKVGVTKELGTDRLQWKCDNVKRLYYEFSNYQGTDLSILKGLDTSKVTTMGRMFADCNYITNLDFINFNTANVTDMSYMFSNCVRLKTINTSNWNTGKVTNMESLFQSCGALTSLDVSSFNTSKVTNMANLFYSCNNMTNLDLSNFDMSKVQYAGSMFHTCRKLISVDFSNTTTSNITSCSDMFRNCDAIITIKNIDLIKPSSLGSLFYGCKELQNLTLYNIKKSLSIGSSTTYGTKLTLDSLVHTIQQLWDLTGSTRQTLTMSTTSKGLIANVYVKLVEPTAEQIEADPNIIYKKNCVVCESTDEGAMTITEYAISKNWAIA